MNRVPVPVVLVTLIGLVAHGPRLHASDVRPDPVPRPVGSSASSSRAADVIFLIDGSGSVSPQAFALQLEAIRSCLCAPGAPLEPDGSAAVAVVQFSSFAEVEIPLTVLDTPAAAVELCDRVGLIDQLNGGTQILPGLGLVEDQFETAPDGTRRSLVILSDTVLFDFSLAQVENACEDLRTARFPVRICAAMTDEGSTVGLGLFENLCNTPDAASYDPSEPSGLFLRLEEISEFQPLCADCVADCGGAGGADCDADGVPDACEPDCDGNGAPDDCDVLADPGRDLNGDGRLDVCEGDCNQNGIPDFLDINSGDSTDCDGNAIPDDCEGGLDCNGNGVPDFCEIDAGLATDCNINGVPDECEGVPFGVVTPRVLAVEGQSPGLGFDDRPYRDLALGVAVHASGRAWYGDVGDPGDPILTPRGDADRARGRIFMFEPTRGRTTRVLREGDLVPGAGAWMNDPPADCGELESFLAWLPWDHGTLRGTPGDAAIRGVAADGSLLLSAEVLVDSAGCDELARTNGLLGLSGLSTTRVFREQLDVCLLDQGMVAGPARVRASGTYVQPEVQASPTDFAWLISRADDGACAVVRSGEPAPDGGVFEVSNFAAGERTYQTVARHAGAGQTLFYAETSVSPVALVLDEEGTRSLVARTGTRSDLPGGPTIQPRFSPEEGCDLGVLRGVGPDVVFRARVAGDDAIFVWEREDNPGSSSDVVRAIVLAELVESVPGVVAAPGSVSLSYPVLGGPCAGCDPGGVVLFKASWFEPQGPAGEPGGDREGLFALTPTDGIVAVALPRRPLPPPHEHLWHAPTPLMLSELDVDMNSAGLVVYSSLVAPPPSQDDPTPTPVSAVLLASIKPGRCDFAPPFGVYDLADITRFVVGLTALDPSVDLAAPIGTFDLADIVAFVGCFLDACP